MLSVTGMRRNTREMDKCRLLSQDAWILQRQHTGRLQKSRQSQQYHTQCIW